MNCLLKSQARAQRVFGIVMFVVFIVAIALSGCSSKRAPSDAPGDYPTQPINIIVGFAAGAGSDQWARSIASAAEKTLGIPVEVTNIVGDGGKAALREFLSAPADGYTLLSVIDIYAAAYASGELDINPAEDLVPLLVGNIAVSQIYIAPDDGRFTTWDEVVAYAKENPNLTVASVGAPLDLEDLGIMSLEQTFAVDLERVIIEDAEERFTAAVTGMTDLLIEQPGDVKELVASGELQPILTLWNERIKGSEDVPAVTELDADFAPLLRFRGLAAHNGVPQARLDFLRAALREAFNSDEFQADLRERSLDVVTYPEDAVAAIREQVEMYEALNQNLKTD